MTNTYSDDASDMTKIVEELRLIRCCLERLVQATPYFVDYQHEKYNTIKDDQELCGKMYPIPEHIAKVIKATEYACAKPRGHEGECD